MNRSRVLALILIWCTSATSPHAQQLNLEFTVVGAGGIATSIGPDTLISTPGQPFAGEDSLGPNMNSSGFIYQVSGGLRTTTVTIAAPVAMDWNIVSLPVSNPIQDDSVRHLFVNAVYPSLRLQIQRRLHAKLYAG